MEKAAMKIKSILALATLYAAFCANPRPQTFIVTSQTGYTWHTNGPFGKGLARFQQVYSHTDIKVGPCTLKSIAFKPYKYSSCKSHTINLEMGFGYSARSPMFLESVFSRNILGNLTPIWAKRNVNLPAIPGSGGFIVKFPFDKPFQYNGKGDLLLEIKIYGNDIGNKEFFYNLLYPYSSMVSYVSNYLSPYATSGTVFKSRGLLTLFRYDKAGFVTFGSGCKGEGGYIPEISNTGIPKIGQSFYVNVTRINGQRFVWLMVGLSNKKWGNINLPFDLTNLGATGCSLLVENRVTYPSLSMGGPVGFGYSRVKLDIPGHNLFLGINLFLQWMVQAPNANPVSLAFSNGGIAIIGR